MSPSPSLFARKAPWHGFACLRDVLGPALSLVLALTLVFAPAWAQSSATSGTSTGEAQIKAAFLCKFGSYVEWPATDALLPDTPFAIGVLGNDAVTDELTRMAQGLTVNGRPVVVRRLAAGDPLDGLAIFFVGRAQVNRLAEMLAAARGQPILTVTEFNDVDASAGMVNFVVVDKKVRFDVLLQPAESSNLKISARLLAVARKVTGKPS